MNEFDQKAQEWDARADHVERALRAFYELLEPQGYLCVADLDKEDGSFHTSEFHGPHGFDREELRAQVRSIGFTDIRFTTAYHMIREVQDSSKDFPVFLMVARR